MLFVIFPLLFSIFYFCLIFCHFDYYIFPELGQKSQDLKAFEQCMKQGNFFKLESSSCWKNSCGCFREVS